MRSLVARVLRVTAAANPTERPEAVVEAHRPHDVLHVTRVAEFFTVLATDIGSGAFAFQQEGVAVVEEIHARAVSVLMAFTCRFRLSSTRFLKAAGSFTINALLSS
jgi:hypothetical protein